MEWHLMGRHQWHFMASDWASASLVTPHLTGVWWVGDGDSLMAGMSEVTFYMLLDVSIISRWCLTVWPAPTDQCSAVHSMQGSQWRCVMMGASWQHSQATIQGEGGGNYDKLFLLSSGLLSSPTHRAMGNWSPYKLGHSFVVNMILSCSTIQYNTVQSVAGLQWSMTNHPITQLLATDQTTSIFRARRRCLAADR